MKILHVVRQFYPMVGGLENYVLHLAREQSRQGYDISVATLNRNYLTGEKLPPRETIKNDIQVIRIPFWGSKKYPLAFRVLRHVREFDLIHVHGVDFFADYLALTSRLHRKRMVLTTHGGFFHTLWASGLKKWYFKIITRQTLKAFNRIIACSKNDQRMFSRISDRVATIENGVDVMEFISTSKKRQPGNLTYIGRIDVHKRVDRLIELTAVLNRKGYDTQLSVAGADWNKLLPSLKNTAQKLGIREKVHFHGPVDAAKLKDILRHTDVFVSASEFEGFGISAVEAMAAGSLVGLSNIESFRSLLNGHDFGQIIDFNNMGEAANQLSRFLDLTDIEYEALSREARKHARVYDWKTACRRINATYMDPDSNQSENKRYKIAYLSHRNALDKRAWSGVLHYIYQTLQNNTGDVVLLGPYQSKMILWPLKLYRIFVRVFFQRKYNLAFSKVLTKAAGRYFTRKIRKEKPDVIVAVASTPFTAYLKTSLPVILVDDANFSQLVDYYPNFSNLSKASFARGHQLTRRAFQKASGIVFSSEWSRKSTIREYQINPDKISVIPYGANLDTVPERQDILEADGDDQWHLLFLGVDWHRKGGDVAFEALEILTAKGFNVRLTVCGTTPPEQYRHEKMEVISFLDKNNQEDFRRLYQLFLSTNFLVVPTRADCTPIVFGEANAFGIPVLTNDTGGVASVIEQGINGILHHTQDTGIQYAQTIESYIRDHRAYRNLVENSRNTYEKRLNWASWGGAIYKLVHNLASEQRERNRKNRKKNHMKRP